MLFRSYIKRSHKAGKNTKILCKKDDIMILESGSDIQMNRCDCSGTVSSFFIRAAVYMRRAAATAERHSSF